MLSGDYRERPGRGRGVSPGHPGKVKNIVSCVAKVSPIMKSETSQSGNSGMPLALYSVRIDVYEPTLTLRFALRAK